MSATPPKRKRGRPPLQFISSSGTTISLRELGITRQQKSDYIALARLPSDVFEAALSDPARMPTTRALVNLARNLPPEHRRGDPLTEAIRAALRLSAADRAALLRVITPDAERNEREAAR